MGGNQQIMKSAAATTLGQNPGTLPNMYSALANLFQPMQATKIAKATVNMELVETPTTQNFMGAKVAWPLRRIEMRPEGERKWQFFTLSCDDSLIMAIDDEFLLGDPLVAIPQQTRVLSVQDLREYGVMVYEVCQDYGGSQS